MKFKIGDRIRSNHNIFSNVIYTIEDIATYNGFLCYRVSWPNRKEFTHYGDIVDVNVLDTNYRLVSTNTIQDEEEII